MNRAIPRILIFLALGLITTIASAWWLALRTDWRAPPRYDPTSGVALLLYDAASQGTIWTFRPVRSAGVLVISAGNTGPTRPDEVRAERTVHNDEVPAWTTMRRGDPRGTAQEVFYLEQGFGWPMLALAQTHRWSRGTHEVDGLPLAEAFQRFGPADWLPRRPIWTGLIANTLLFAWIWFSIASFPGIVLRAARRRRGACPRCGYDTRYTTSGACPECGARM